MLNKPGIGGESFIIKFSENWYKKRDVLTAGYGAQVVVTKVYNQWWRRLLLKLGFKVKLFNCVKVKYL